MVHPAGEGIIWGPGTAERELNGLLERLGVERPFLVTTGSVERSGLADRVAAVMGDRLTGRFAGSREHTPEPAVLEGAAAASAAGADGLVALGGSSVVDLTKGMAMVLAEGTDLRQLRSHYENGVLRRPRLTAPKLPQIALPTTLSGAEFTGAAGITDVETGAKRIYIDPKLTPRWVILDPDLAADTPPELWAATGMKALADTVEVLCSRRATPLSDALAAASLAMLLANLGPSLAQPGAPAGDNSTGDQAAAMGRCQYAVGMVLPQLALVGAGLVAGLRHQLGGGLGVGHGVASTIVLPHVLRWNQPFCTAQLASAARAADLFGASGLIAAIESLTRTLGLPTRLRDVGVAQSDLASVADHVLGDQAIGTNPRPVTTETEVLEVLTAAW